MCSYESMVLEYITATDLVCQDLLLGVSGQATCNWALLKTCIASKKKAIEVASYSHLHDMETQWKPGNVIHMVKWYQAFPSVFAYCKRSGKTGRLQSLDWSSGLDWWTDTKNHPLLTRPTLTCGVMWKSCSLAYLCTYSHKTNKLGLQ